VNNKTELMARIEVALENIRPYLAADGGGITLVDITTDMTALVELTGACTNCSMSSMTMKAGVESTIKSAVPEIARVEAVS
jgi:Fe-S cluster biogenesis protein NfuA